jgi:hypothetical protein
VRGGDLEAENRELRKRTKQLKQENEILRRATACLARDCKPRTQQRCSCHAVVHIVLNACASSPRNAPVPRTQQAERPEALLPAYLAPRFPSEFNRIGCELDTVVAEP